MHLIPILTRIKKQQGQGTWTNFIKNGSGADAAKLFRPDRNLVHKLKGLEASVPGGGRRSKIVEAVEAVCGSWPRKNVC